jgi:hypothetical protein
MNKLVIAIVLVVICLIFFIFGVSTLGSDESNFWLGLFALVTGSISLFQGLKKGETGLTGLKFRLVLAGITGIICGVVIVIDFLI